MRRIDDAHAYCPVTITVAVTGAPARRVLYLDDGILGRLGRCDRSGSKYRYPAGLRHELHAELELHVAE